MYSDVSLNSDDYELDTQFRSRYWNLQWYSKSQAMTELSEMQSRLLKLITINTSIYPNIELTNFECALIPTTLPLNAVDLLDIYTSAIESIIHTGKYGNCVRCHIEVFDSLVAVPLGHIVRSPAEVNNWGYTIESCWILCLLINILNKLSIYLIY